MAISRLMLYPFLKYRGKQKWKTHPYNQILYVLYFFSTYLKLLNSPHILPRNGVCRDLYFQHQILNNLQLLLEHIYVPKISILPNRVKDSLTKILNQDDFSLMNWQMYHNLNIFPESRLKELLSNLSHQRYLHLS